MTRRAEGQRLHVAPAGRLGVDLRKSAELLDPEELRRAEHCRGDDVAIRRRRGPRRISSVAPTSYGLTFNDDGKYGRVADSATMRRCYNGCAVHFGFIATRPASGKTAFLWSNHVDGQAYGKLWATLSDAGVLTTYARLASGSTISIATSAITSGAAVTGWNFFDPLGRLFSLWIDGRAAGTPVVLATSDRLNPSLSIDGWYFGVDWDPALAAGAGAVTADTKLPGRLESWTLLDLAGVSLTEGSPTLRSQLLRLTFQKWPAPGDAMTLASFDFNEGSGATIHDRSGNGNDMTLTGSPTFGACEAVHPVRVVNMLRRLELANAELHNMEIVGGVAYRQKIREAVT